MKRRLRNCLRPEGTACAPQVSLRFLSPRYSARRSAGHRHEGPLQMSSAAYKPADPETGSASWALGVQPQLPPETGGGAGREARVTEVLHTASFAPRPPLPSQPTLASSGDLLAPRLGSGMPLSPTSPPEARKQEGGERGGAAALPRLLPGAAWVAREPDRRRPLPGLARVLWQTRAPHRAAARTRTNTHAHERASPPNEDAVVSSSISSVLESSELLPPAKGGEVTGGASGRPGCKDMPWRGERGKWLPTAQAGTLRPVTCALRPAICVPANLSRGRAGL